MGTFFLDVSGQWNSLTSSCDGLVCLQLSWSNQSPRRVNWLQEEEQEEKKKEQEQEQKEKEE